METVENTRLLHNEAMKMAQKAMLAQEQGDPNKALALFEEAFLMEKSVAMSLLHAEKEPSRSVFFRSAASLAVNCHRFKEAKELIQQGLNGTPPSSITAELLNLFEEATEMELDAMFHQKRKELDDFIQTKTKELRDTIKQARAAMGNS